MSKKNVSMKDIAKELGVSVALVSYVLNGKFTNRINVETASRIKDLAQKLNYKPNQIAKSLQSNKSFTIGLVVADISNLFYSSIAHYIEEEANILGYNVLFGSAYEDAIRFKSVIDIFISKQVDGLILAVPDGGEQYLSYIEEIGIPFVVIDREFVNIDRSLIVNIDNYQASNEVVHHLFDGGSKRIGGIALATNLIHLQKRKLGFIETAEQLVGEYNTFLYEVLEKELDEQIEKVVLNAILVDKVDALYFFTNRIAMSALSVLARYDIEVPEKVAVVCFDEADAYRIFKQELTYVRQPLQAMSRQAVKVVLDKSFKKEQNLFFAELIEKGSSSK